MTYRVKAYEYVLACRHSATPILRCHGRRTCARETSACSGLPEVHEMLHIRLHAQAYTTEACSAVWPTHGPCGGVKSKELFALGCRGAERCHRHFQAVTKEARQGPQGIRSSRRRRREETIETPQITSFDAIYSTKSCSTIYCEIPF